MTDGKYRLYKHEKMTEKAGSITWLNKGEVEAVHGYLWDEEMGETLTGYFNKKVYTNRNTALKVCSASGKCTGVTKEGPNNYRCNTGTTLKPNSKRTAWIQKTSVVTHQKVLFSVLPSYTLDKVEKTNRGSEKAAAVACIKKPDCTGFVKRGSAYYIALGWTIFSDENSVSYIRNDMKLAFVTYSLYLKEYYWQVKAPYVHKHLKKDAYKTLPQALEACVADPSCKGISFVTKKGNYYLAKSTELKIGHGRTYNKGTKAVIGDGYMWTRSGDNNKIDGDYLDSSTYGTLTAALKACSKKPACTGVTKINNHKFRLGKIERTARRNGYSAYLRGSSSVTYRQRVWTEVIGFNLAKPTTTFKDLKTALFACSKSKTCTGVDKTPEGKFMVATSTELVSRDGGSCWLKGGAGYVPQFSYDSKYCQLLNNSIIYPFSYFLKFRIYFKFKFCFSASSR